MKIKKIKYICKSSQIAAMLVSLVKNKGIKPGVFIDFDPKDGYNCFAVEIAKENYKQIYKENDLIFDFASDNSYYSETLKSVSLEKMIEYLLTFPAPK